MEVVHIGIFCPPAGSSYENWLSQVFYELHEYERSGSYSLITYEPIKVVRNATHAIPPSRRDALDQALNHGVMLYWTPDKPELKSNHPGVRALFEELEIIRSIYTPRSRLVIGVSAKSAYCAPIKSLYDGRVPVTVHTTLDEFCTAALDVFSRLPPP